MAELHELIERPPAIVESLARVKRWLDTPPEQRPVLYGSDVRILVNAYEQLQEDYQLLRDEHMDDEDEVYVIRGASEEGDR